VISVLAFEIEVKAEKISDVCSRSSVTVDIHFFFLDSSFLWRKLKGCLRVTNHKHPFGRFREEKTNLIRKKMNINCEGRARTHIADFLSLSTSISKAKTTLTWMCEDSLSF
jgi:hypothetical protein